MFDISCIICRLIRDLMRACSRITGCMPSRITTKYDRKERVKDSSQKWELANFDPLWLRKS